MTSIHVFDTLSNTWTPINATAPVIPSSRTSHVAVVSKCVTYNNTMFLTYKNPIISFG